MREANVGQLAVRARVVGVTAGEVYRRIAAFPTYLGLCEAVREVVVLEKGDHHMVTSWEVNFHRGILRWVERADFQPDNGVINFAEVDGDVDEFRGAWTIEDDGDDGVSVVFSVVFDIGIPTLEHILDPIAEEALYDNISSILSGLLGDAVTVLPAATEPAVTEPAVTEPAVTEPAVMEEAS
jgi:ribosome-associated toxin RatA of RatAB toxin-antitoxin module